jgi:tetratricopeptide (TPR) repeat protein
LRSRDRLLAILLALVAAACTTSATVTRAVDGRLVRVRYIEQEAYAAYLNAAILENRGDLDAAEAAYGEAIGRDPKSAEIWTRIGVVRCKKIKLGREGASPWDAFRRADEIDPEMEESATARARCHLDLGEIHPALAAARKAVALDPNRMEPAALLALILERAGQIDSARLWMDGLALREPGSVEAQTAMIDFATRTGDRSRRIAAAEARGQLRREGFVEADGSRRRATIGEIDEALVHGNVSAARGLASAAGVGAAALALRATAIGQTAFASEQAEIAADADPSDSDARIAAAVAADLARDDVALAKAVTGLATGMTAPSPLGRALLLELVERRCVLRAVAEPAERLDRSTADPLVVKVVERARSEVRP